MSLLADALHTLSDLLTSVIVMVGFRIARKPPDARHPYGHGRMESVSAMIVAVILATVAFEMGKAGVERILDPREITPTPWLIIALVATIVVKELLAQLSGDLGEFIESSSLKADGAHQRSDAITTVLVIAAFVGAKYDIVWLDGVMALGVAALIALAAYHAFQQAVGPLLGERAPQKMIREIRDIARAIPDVKGVHGIMVHRYGPRSVVSLHIEVPLSDPIRMHTMAQALEDKIVRRYPGHAVVHVDPINTDHPHYDEVSRMISETLDTCEARATFHDLRLIGGGQRFKVVFDLVPERSARENVAGRIHDRLRDRLRERFPDCDVVMRTESPFFPDGPDGEVPGHR